MNPRETKPNRLIHEKSPYLLQHTHNPVDWYPWGDEAFEKARREDKPIFLSIGYSTCYWCHVMEREVFENHELAALMNTYVVSVKVDREERPDIDRVYMSALQAMSGSGGWPMSMFLTHELKPFFGATYIPPTAQYGRAGFREILEHIHTIWTTDRKEIEQAGRHAGEYLQHLANPETKPAALNEETLDAGFHAFMRSYDVLNAGFGSAPKFPRPVVFNFLLRYFKRTGNQQALEMSLETLKQMARGGMYDHIGGGFHRYSTDGHWHVPHFEKMLYDQAQLAISYLEAYQITHDQSFSGVAHDILNYVLRVMAHPAGGFYSAEDAESLPVSADRTQETMKQEGAFYVWTKDEIDDILSPEEARLFNHCSGVEESGNVQADPHRVFRGKNILHVIHSPDELARQFDLSIGEVKNTLDAARGKLFEARERRPHCHLDDKILTSWNGLMISALARAYQVLQDGRFVKAANKAADFLLKELRDGATGELLHRYRDGEARFEAHLDDYAFLVQGLLDLFEATFNLTWLKAAMELTERMVGLFYDSERGAWFDTTGRDKSVLIRTKEWYDGAEPSGNAVAVLDLLRLAQMTDNARYGTLAKDSIAFFGEHIQTAPQAAPQFLVALEFSLTKPKQIIIAGTHDDQQTELLLREIHSRFIPNKILLLADGGESQRELASHLPFLGEMKVIDGKATAYICEDYACQLPTTDRTQLAHLLER